MHSITSVDAFGKPTCDDVTHDSDTAYLNVYFLICPGNEREALGYKLTTNTSLPESLRMSVRYQLNVIIQFRPDTLLRR